MSDDSFLETTSESWFSRMGKAIVGIIFGFVIFIAAFPLLFWNEGRSVKRYKTLKEGQGIVITVASDRLNAENSGELVHMTGMAATDDVLKDPVFGLGINAIKLRRIVEMYQWEEHKKSEKKKKLGGGTTTTTEYSYTKKWSEQHISSSGFKKTSGHENPASMPVKSQTFKASVVQLGAFILSDNLVDDINRYEQVPFNFSNLPGQWFDRPVHKTGNGLYLGQSVNSPAIGDIRIRFEAAQAMPVSVVARQTGEVLSAYQSKAGGTIERLQVGTHSADAMFAKAQKENTLLTWGLRIAGFIVMTLGIAFILRPLSVAMDVLPMLGSITGVGIFLVSFAGAAGLTLTTVSIAWIFYRPVFAVGLLVVAAGIVVAFFMLKRKNKPTAAGSTPAQPPASPPPPKAPPVPAPDAAARPGAKKALPDIGAPPAPPGSVSVSGAMAQGKAFFQKGDYKKAVQAFTKVLRQAPENSSALYNRGIAFYKAGSKDQAKKDFSAAARLGNRKAADLLKKM